MNYSEIESKYVLDVIMCIVFTLSGDSAQEKILILVMLLQSTLKAIHEHQS